MHNIAASPEAAGLILCAATLQQKLVIQRDGFNFAAHDL